MNIEYMKLISIILLLLFSPINIYAEELEEYWWGKKFPEVDAKVNKLVEDMQYAVINDDYKRIEQYLKFPIKFYIDGKRHTGKRVKRYARIANNLAEFEKLFKKMLKIDTDSLDNIRESNFMKTYYGISRVDIEWSSMVGIEMQCNKFVPTPERDFICLPKELSLCEEIDAKIEIISATLTEPKKR